MDQFRHRHRIADPESAVRARLGVPARAAAARQAGDRSEEHTSELQSRGHIVCRLLLLSPRLSPLFPYTTLFRSDVRSYPVYLLGALICVMATQVTYLNAIKWTNSGTATVLQTLNLLFVLAWVCLRGRRLPGKRETDRKSTRLNSSHVAISYAVFCFFLLVYLPSFPTRRSSDLTCAPTPSICSARSSA